MARDDIFQQLNNEQLKAVQHTEGSLLVLAGAGSGKTRVITFRILNLLRNKDVPPENILGVTFTNKAAKEMKERINKLAGKYVRGLTISTFHSFGVRILRENIDLLKYKNNFNIYDANDQKNIVNSIFNEMHIDKKALNINLTLKHISLAKNSNQAIKFLNEIENDEYRLLITNIYKRYQEILKNYNSVDFDDLIILPIKILKKFKEVKNKYQKQYKYVLVDEYQDTNNIQYQFLKQILNKEKNICVVGDDDQAIYGFRGSKVEHILKFEKDFPSTITINLTKNYRSTQNILHAANELIKNNKARHKKIIKSTKKTGNKILIMEKIDEKNEAEFIVNKIAEYHHKFNISWQDMAILYRTNFQSRPFEEFLRLKDIPYNIVGGMKFYDRKEIKDILAYLKLIANEKDEISLLRIINYPRRGIGDKTVFHLNQYGIKKKIPLYEALKDASKIDEIKPSALSNLLKFVKIIEKYKKEFLHTHKPMYKIAHEMVKDIRYEEEIINDIDQPHLAKWKMNNISELISSIKAFEDESSMTNEESGLYNYLNKISLITKEEEKKEEKNQGRVSLMTFHISKGLEFRAVFLVGIEEKLLPHLKTIEEGGSIEEERRMFYVGITRAREHLVITHALTRRRFGITEEALPSRFIRELPDGNIIHEEEIKTPDKTEEDNTREQAFIQMREIFNKEE